MGAWTPKFVIRDTACAFRRMVEVGRYFCRAEKVVRWGKVWRGYGQSEEMVVMLEIV